MATTAQQNSLQTLYDDYLAKKALYDIELVDNYKAHQGWNPNDPTGSGSDASLAVKKTNMDNAWKAYNALKEDIAAADKAAQEAAAAASQAAAIKAESDFKAAHPEQAQQIEATKAAAQVQLETQKAELKLKADLAAAKENYAQSQAKMITIAGIVLVLITVGTIIYVKVFKKKNSGI